MVEMPPFLAALPAVEAKQLSWQPLNLKNTQLALRLLWAIFNGEPAKMSVKIKKNSYDTQVDAMFHFSFNLMSVT